MRSATFKNLIILKNIENIMLRRNIMDERAGSAMPCGIRSPGMQVNALQGKPT
jgi:hypothetical protein